MSIRMLAIDVMDQESEIQGSFHASKPRNLGTSRAGRGGRRALLVTSEKAAVEGVDTVSPAAELSRSSLGSRRRLTLGRGRGVRRNRGPRAGCAVLSRGKSARESAPPPVSCDMKRSAREPLWLP
jgi:hypothetical protein